MMIDAYTCKLWRHFPLGKKTDECIREQSADARSGRRVFYAGRKSGWQKTETGQKDADGRVTVVIVAE